MPAADCAFDEVAFDAVAFDVCVTAAEQGGSVLFQNEAMRRIEELLREDEEILIL